MKTFVKISDTEYEVTETKISDVVVDKVIVNIPDIQKRKDELEAELQSLNDILDNVDVITPIIPVSATPL